MQPSAPSCMHVDRAPRFAAAMVSFGYALFLAASMLCCAAETLHSAATTAVALNVTQHATQPIEGQKPGTSGLRVKTRVAMRPGFVTNYAQAVLDAVRADAMLRPRSARTTVWPLTVRRHACVPRQACAGETYAAKVTAFHTAQFENK